MRGRILGREPLPSSREVFSEVRREESRRSVMLGLARSPTETSALTSKQYGESSLHETQPGKRPEKVVCDHCNKPWHTQDKCWKLHGKPATMRNNRPTTRGYTAFEDNYQPRTPELLNFTKEQLEQLSRLITSSQPSNPPLYSLYLSSQQR